jgi:hypothetical protein
MADDIHHPGFDFSRFDVSYWQKFDRALRFARDRDIIFSLVLDMNDSRVHPFAGSADEHRFIRYAIARFAAFSNITWDLGDDLDTCTIKPPINQHPSSGSAVCSTLPVSKA